MSAEKFFELYSIEEISKRTKISPVSLRLIKEKKFDKIPRVKFLGFINVIQREFNVDLSELIDEYNSYSNPPKEELLKEEIITPPKNKKPFILLFLILLLIISGIYLYKQTPKKQIPKTVDINISKTVSLPEKNLSNTLKKIQTVIKKETNISKDQNKAKTIPKEITVIPLQKIWFRAINLDNNKTFEYLTSKPKTLEGANYYIKLGHGLVNIIYGDKNITPNTKKIVKIILKNGEYNYTKTPPPGYSK
ncbi:MAG: hypothetical protein ABGX25_02135 [Nautiliaceae bacterium]